MTDHNEIYKRVGEKIRAARGKNLSQEALASAIGMTRSSISNIEKGRQKLLLHTLLDISDALQVQPASLLPDRPAPVKLDDASKLAQLPDKERAFIASAIGINENQEGPHGRQKK
jgi:transcriptional regulator with XRE-family HTH domain